MDAKREPVILPMAILAALQVFFGGLAGITALSDQPMIAAIAACGNLAVGAAQTGVMFWVRGQVTPTADLTADQRAAVPSYADAATGTPTGHRAPESGLPGSVDSAGDTAAGGNVAQDATGGTTSDPAGRPGTSRPDQGSGA